MVQPWVELDELDNPSDPYAELAIDSATYILWALSGRKYGGVNTTTEQYVCPQYDLPVGCSWETNEHFYTINGYNGYVVPPHLVTGSQKYGTRFRLRNRPVRKIHSVSIDGQELPSGSYYIRNTSELVISYSYCSSLCDGPEVTYTYGVRPPSLGRLAAIEMANEYVKYFNNEECSLPERVTSVQRKGISIEMYDPADFLDKGRIGLQLADTFIATTNPGRALKPAKVFSPDLPRGYSKR